MTETDAPIRAKIPFRLRLKAWWNGYDLELRRKEADAAALKIDDKKHEVHYQAPTFDWRTARIALVQEVWGPGFVGPGGEEAILKAGLPVLHVRAQPSDESDDECRESDSDSDDGADDAEKLRVGHGSFLSGCEHTASMARRWFRQERVAGWSIVGVAARG